MATVTVDMTAIEVAGKKEKLDAEGVLKLIKDHLIDGVEGFGTAVGMVAKVKRTFKERDGRRKEHVAPLNAEVKSVNGELKPGLEFLTEAEKILKEKIGAFVVDQFTKRRKLLTAAETAIGNGDQEKADALIAEAAEFEAPKIAGCAIGEVWKGKVTDADQIPPQYLIPDVAALEALTKASKKDPKIPGWTVGPEPTVTITESKVKV